MWFKTVRIGETFSSLPSPDVLPERIILHHKLLVLMTFSVTSIIVSIGSCFMGLGMLILELQINSYFRYIHSTYIPSLSPAHPNNSPQVASMSPALRTPGSVTINNSPGKWFSISPYVIMITIFLNYSLIYWTVFLCYPHLLSAILQSPLTLSSRLISQLASPHQARPLIKHTPLPHKQKNKRMLKSWSNCKSTSSLCREW